MKEDGKLKLRYTWPVIILFWIVFWPIGLTLTCFRVSFEKPELRGAMVWSIIGGFWYFFTIFMIFILLWNGEGVQENNIVPLIFGVVLGAIHRMIAKRKRKKVLEAGADIQKDMYQERTGAYTYATKNVELNDSPVSVESAEPIKSERDKAAPLKNAEREVVCENCGATNTIHGASGECEYCGSLLK